MHSDIRRGLDMLRAAGQFEPTHPAIPPNARAAFLFAEVRAAGDEIYAMSGTQDASRGRFRSAASERQFIAATMRGLMRQIARVARVLDRKEYPGAREKLMVPRSNGYSALLTRASVFLETIPAIKSAFIERGMPADFDLRLQALIEDFKAATTRRTNGLYTQVGSTAGMKARLREGVRAVRELDVILGLLLQHVPALYASWRSASHIQRAPRRSDKSASGNADSPVESAAASAGNAPTQDIDASSLDAVAPDPGSPPGLPI